MIESDPEAMKRALLKAQERSSVECDFSGSTTMGQRRDDLALEWSADYLLERFQRMVTKQDYWRGYVGYDESDPSDEEVYAWLQEARDALAAVGQYDPKPWETDECQCAAGMHTCGRGKS